MAKGSFEFSSNNLKRLCQKVEIDVKVKQCSGFIIDSVLKKNNDVTADIWKALYCFDEMPHHLRGFMLGETKH